MGEGGQDVGSEYVNIGLDGSEDIDNDSFETATP
jgi:hypothetical protein